MPPVFGDERNRAAIGVEPLGKFTLNKPRHLRGAVKMTPR